MTASVVVQPEAEADLVAAFAWYERRRTGLGHEFLIEIDRIIARIAEKPMLAAPVYRDVRRTKPGRFPYVVFYVPREDHIHILGVLHQRRDPKLGVTRADDFDSE